MDRVQAARAQFALREVFFATILYGTPAIKDDSVGTACTDMVSIRYSPKFFNTLDTETIMFVWAHEVLHIAYKHGLRRGNRNPKLWNIACDYMINLQLNDNGFKLWKDKDGKMLCLFDTKWRGMSAEQIYDKLQQELDEKRKRRKQQSGDQSNQSDQQSGSGGGDPLDDMDTDGLHGDVDAPGNMDQEQMAEIERTINQRVAQAANMSRMAGKLSGDLARMVDEILNPKIPWTEVLREYLHTTVNHDESWSRRNRRFQQVYLPARWSEKLGEIAIIGDTSGSISPNELCRYAAEVNYIVDNLMPERIRTVWADVRVAGEQVFEQGDAFAPQPKGGGGTDMRVPLDHVSQYNPDVVILFTDGYTPWPDTDPDYPLIVCCTTDAPVPVGHVVRI